MLVPLTLVNVSKSENVKITLLGTGNVGDGNSQAIPFQFPAYGYNNDQAEAVIGANNAGSYLIGSQQQGSYLIGSQQEGTDLIGFNNTGTLATGVSNYESIIDTIGAFNVNGTEVIGQGNNGSYLVGFINQGNGIVGYEGTGSLLYGFNVTGFNNTGVDLEGSGLIGAASNYSIVIGYNCSGQNIVGVNNDVDGTVGSFGTFDNPVLPNYNVNFALPSGSLSTIGSNYNTLPTTEQASSTGAFITQITAEYKFNIDVPAILSVVDLGCAGDLISVYDFGSLLFTTTAPSSTTLSCSQMSLSDPDAALAEYSYSRGFGYLAPGLHALTFTVAAGGNGTALAFRIDSIGQGTPCGNNQCPGPVPFLNTVPRTPLVPTPPPWSLPKIIKEAELMAGTGAGTGTSAGVGMGTGMATGTGTGTGTNPALNPILNTTIASLNPNNTQLIQPCNCNNDTLSLTDSSTISQSTNSKSNSVYLSRKSKSKFQVKRIGRFLLVTGSEVEWSRAGLVCAKLGSKLAVPKKEGDKQALMALPGVAWVGADWRGNRMGGACLQLNGEGKILIASSCKLKLSVLCERI